MAITNGQQQPPIPAHIWKRITAWLKAGGSGRIMLDAHRGAVSRAWIREEIGDDTMPLFDDEADERDDDT